MANDISVKIKLDGEKEYRQALKQCNEAMKNADSALKAFDESVKGDAKSVENLQKRQELLTAALEEAKKKQDTLNEVVAKAKKARDDAAAALEKARKEEGENSAAVQKAEQNYISANSAVNRWETQLNKANQEVAKYTNEISGASDETADFQAVVANTAAMEALTKVAEKVSGAFSGINKMASEAAEDIADGYATIITKTGATGASLEAMQEVADNLFSSMPVTMEQVGSAIGEVNTRFGLTGEALQETSKQFLEFAKINGTDVSGSVDAVQKALAAFGENADGAGTLLDVLNRTGQKTGISMSTLTGSLSSNAAAFSEMGLNIYESVGFLGDLEVSGADVSSVLAGMKKAMQKATEEGKPLNEALSDLQNAVVNGTDGMDGLSEAYELFGTRSGAQVYNAVKNGKIDFQNLTSATDILVDATGNLASTYEAALTPAEKMKIAQNNLDSVTGGLHLQFQEALTPAVETLTGVLSDATKKFKDLPPEIQTTIAVIGGIGTKVGEVLPQILTLATQMKTLNIAKDVAGGVDSLNTATGKSSGSFKDLAGNIGLAVAGFALFVEGAKTVIGAHDKLTGKSQEFADKTDEVVDSVNNLADEMAGLDEELQNASTDEEKLRILNEKLKKAQDNHAAATDKAQQATDKLNDKESYNLSLKEQIFGALQPGTSLVLEQAAALLQDQESQEKANTAQEDAIAIEQDLQARIDELTASMEESTDATNETADAVNGLADTTSESEGRISYANALLLSDYGDTMARVADAVNGVKDSLIEGAQSVGNWFDEVGEKQKLSADDLAQNLANQIEHMKNWEENLKILADSGINEGLLQYLADMGPAGAEYVQAFVDAANGETEVGIEEMNALWQEKIDIEAGINEEAQDVYEAVGAMVAGSKEELDRMAQVAKDAGEDVPEELAAGINAASGNSYSAAYSLGTNTKQGLDDANAYGNAYSIGENLVWGIVKGIDYNADAAVNAAASMANRTISKTRAIMAIASPSKVFAEIGKFVDLGLAQGIDKYAYTATDAVTDMSNSLTDMQLPDMSRFHETGMINNEVKVYIGDQELTGIMAAGVIRNISTNQAAFAAAGGM